MKELKESLFAKIVFIEMIQIIWRKNMSRKKKKDKLSWSDQQEENKKQKTIDEFVEEKKEDG